MSEQWATLVSQEEENTIRARYEGADFFKTRSPKLYGVGKNYNEAMREVQRKIQTIARFGKYQEASIGTVLRFRMDALTYVYPSVTFYRTERVRN